MQQPIQGPPNQKVLDASAPATPAFMFDLHGYLQAHARELPWRPQAQRHDSSKLIALVAGLDDDDSDPAEWGQDPAERFVKHLRPFEQPTCDDVFRVLVKVCWGDEAHARSILRETGYTLVRAPTEERQRTNEAMSRTLQQLTRSFPGLKAS